MIKFSTPQEIIAADAQSDQAQAENFFEGVKHRVTDSKGQQFSLGDFELPPTARRHEDSVSTARSSRLD